MPAFNATVQLGEPVATVQARIVADLREHELYRLNQKRIELQDQPGLVVVIHKYRPGWAIVVGIIGLLFFLLGALFFLVKNTDVLSLSITPRGDGAESTVAVSGKAETWMIVCVQRAIGSSGH